MRFLGIDVGTTSIKAVVLNDYGKILEFAETDVSDLLKTPQTYWVQRDATKLWHSVVSTVNKLQSRRELAAICVDATSGTIVPVNREGAPLYPEIMYDDKRAQAELGEIVERSQSASDYEVFLPLDPTLVIPKILWLRKNTKILARTYKILHENDFIVMKLCGEPSTSPNTAGKAHTDIRTGRYQEQIYADLDIDLDLLPSIRPIGEIVGNTTYEISRESEIPRNTPIINGVTDATAGDLSAGVIEAGQVGVNMGATMVIHAVVNQITPDPKKRLYHKAYIENKYVVGGATDAGTRCLELVSRLLGMGLRELDNEAEGAPPGSGGLIAQPQWVGTRVPDFNPDVKGYLVGLTEENCTPGNIFRAFLEGNAILLDQTLKIIKNLSKTEVNEIRVCGGGAKSDIQNQIFADVTGHIVRVAETSVPAKGSAIIACWGLSKRKKAITEMARETVSARKTFLPNPQNEKVYEIQKAAFTRITKNLYPAQ